MTEHADLTGARGEMVVAGGAGRPQVVLRRGNSRIAGAHVERDEHHGRQNTCGDPTQCAASVDCAVHRARASLTPFLRGWRTPPGLLLQGRDSLAGGWLRDRDEPLARCPPHLACHAVREPCGVARVPEPQRLRLRKRLFLRGWSMEECARMSTRP